MQIKSLKDNKKKILSWFYSFLPSIAPLFFQMGAAPFLVRFVPVSIAAGSILGLFVSYSFGSRGFFISSTLWGVLLFFHQDFLIHLFHILFVCLCVASWWLATLCSEQLVERTKKLQEIVSNLFQKNKEIESQNNRNATLLYDERKVFTHKIKELESLNQDLQEQLKDHRRHLSLAWQETSGLKEEFEMQKADFQVLLESSKNEIKSLMHLKEVNTEQFMQLQHELHEVNSLYKQLKMQFIEKTQVLSESRKQFFYKESQCLFQNKMIEELQWEDSDAYWIQDIKELIFKCRTYENEILELEQIITQLICEDGGSSKQDGNVKSSPDLHTAVSAISNL